MKDVFYSPYLFHFLFCVLAGVKRDSLAISMCLKSLIYAKDLSRIYIWQVVICCVCLHRGKSCRREEKSIVCV